MKRIQAAILIPWVNIALEEELYDLLRADIGVHWARLRPESLPSDGHDTSYMDSMLQQVRPAMDRFAGLHFDAVILGCTSASFSEVATRISLPNAHSEAHWATTFGAILDDLNRIKAKRIILFAPYDTKTLNSEVQQLEVAGIKVINAIQIPYRDEIRYITAEQICTVFKETYMPEIDAILFSCTGMYTLEAIQMIKRDTNVTVPIFSSNLSIINYLNRL